MEENLVNFTRFSSTTSSSSEEKRLSEIITNSKILHTSSAIVARKVTRDLGRGIDDGGSLVATAGKRARGSALAVCAVAVSNLHLGGGDVARYRSVSLSLSELTDS